MALVNHRYGGATLRAISMAAKVQHNILQKRFKRLTSRLQTKGTRKIAAVDM